ncbi:DNA mobilization endonuclease VirD1/MobC family subunit [Ensifer sp. YR511]|uniref:DNA mobilization endonuclease VirD1/MobC family subunit n=1 Tax=Ensifer sp. YR511 TaxID=1855294 RepID=UPI000B7E02B3|nr:DNA mobilization endonuclease VirD1/MobC family subunit [Ensifer sp. YR511]
MRVGATTDLLGDLPVSKNTPVGRNPKDYKIVSVRLRQAEFESFSEQVQAMGLTHNLALRIAARRISGFLEIDAETRRSLWQISDKIGEISGNLMHLRRIADRSGTLDMDKLAEYRTAFGREFAVLDDKLQTLLNVSQRRIDGCAMLKESSKT